MYLVVAGLFLALWGAAGLIVGFTTDERGFGMATLLSIFIVIGAFLLSIGIASAIAGMGALLGRTWGRWSGIIVAAILAACLGLATLLAAVVLTLGGLTAFSVGFAGASLVLTVGYLLAAVALVRADTYFENRWQR